MDVVLTLAVSGLMITPLYVAHDPGGGLLSTIAAGGLT